MSIAFKVIVNLPNVIGITFQHSLSKVFRAEFFGGSLGGKNPCVMEGSGESKQFIAKTLELSSQCDVLMFSYLNFPAKMFVFPWAMFSATNQPAFS